MCYFGTNRFGKNCSRGDNYATEYRCDICVDVTIECKTEDCEFLSYKGLYEGYCYQCIEDNEINTKFETEESNIEIPKDVLQIILEYCDFEVQVCLKFLCKYTIENLSIPKVSLPYNEREDHILSNKMMKKTRSLHTTYELYHGAFEVYKFEDETTIFYGVEELRTMSILDDDLFERMPNLKRGFVLYLALEKEENILRYEKIKNELKHEHCDLKCKFCLSIIKQAENENIELLVDLV